MASRNSKDRSILCRCKTHFDILNRVGVDHDCDGQTDRTGVSNIATTRAKKNLFRIFFLVEVHAYSPTALVWVYKYHSNALWRSNVLV